MSGMGQWIDRWADFQPRKTAIVFQGRAIPAATRMRSGGRQKIR